MDQPLRPVTRDEVYYIQHVVFQVGSTLFRVPRNVFDIPGTIFEAMFALPSTPDAEGSTDENPIVLHVDENRFRGFLRVICGPRGQEVPDEVWLSALDLATLWTFDDIRRMAIQALDAWARSQSLKQVVLIAKKYNIGSWLQMAYSQLALQNPLRFNALTETPAIDWETIARLLYAKQLRADVVDHYGDQRRTMLCLGETSPLGSSANAQCCFQCGTGKLCCKFIDSSVRTIFKAEFESMKEKLPEDPALPEDGPGASTGGKKKKKKK